MSEAIASDLSTRAHATHPRRSAPPIARASASRLPARRASGTLAAPGITAAAAATRRAGVTLDGRAILGDAELLEPAGPLGRIAFRTGALRSGPLQRTPHSPGTDAPRVDERVPARIVQVDDPRVTPTPTAGLAHQ